MKFDRIDYGIDRCVWASPSAGIPERSFLFWECKAHVQSLMIANAAYILAMIVNVLWFSAAFRYFSFQHKTAARMMVAKSARNSPVFPTMAAAIRFLGGMNGAFALLSILLLIIALSGVAAFTTPLERAVLLVALAAAHFSQFIFNVPVLKNGGRQGETYWDVLQGPMRFIFVVDAITAAISLLAALAQFIL